MGILSRFFDDAESRALSLIDEAQRAFNDFDIDSTVKSIRDGFNGFVKNVKDTISDFKVIVPFDERYETFAYNIENGVLKVDVKGKNGSRQVEATLPVNAKIDEAKYFIDKKHKNVTVVIPKDISKDENVKKIKETATKSFNGTANWIKEALKNRAESVASSTTPPTSKPKTRKKPIPKTAGYARGKDGKFVSAKKA